MSPFELQVWSATFGARYAVGAVGDAHDAFEAATYAVMELRDMRRDKSGPFGESGGGEASSIEEHVLLGVRA